MRLALSSAAYPPDLDGIGDYTWWLAGALARENAGDVCVFTREGNLHPAKGWNLMPVFDPANLNTVAKLPDALSAPAGMSPAIG